MPGIVPHRKKLRNRVRRLRGQIDAIERALDNKEDSISVMRLLTAGRGALNAIMAEVVDDHIHTHMLDDGRKASLSEAKAAGELVEILKSYIR